LFLLDGIQRGLGAGVVELGVARDLVEIVYVDLPRPERGREFPGGDACQGSLFVGLLFFEECVQFLEGLEILGMFG